MKNLVWLALLINGLNLCAQSFVQKGQTLLNQPSISHIRMGEVVDISKDGNTIAVGYGGTTTTKGAVKVFDWNGSTWVQRGAAILGDNNGDFAYVVSMSGDGMTLAVGSPYWDYVLQGITHTDVGKIRIFDWNGTAWVLRSALTANLQLNSNTPNLGSSIDLSSDAKTLVVAAPGYAGGGNNGLYAVYDWDGTNWMLNSSTALSSPANKVAINALRNRIAYSRSNLNSTSAGRVVIMNKNGTSLSLSGTIVSDSLDDNFGAAMALDGQGNTCIIGANFGRNNGVYTGYVKIYQRSFTGSWTQKGSTLYGDAFSAFGASVAINYSGNRIFVGKPESFASHPTKRGAVKVYDWDGTNWVEIEEILGERNNYNFGLSISCDSLGQTFSVGSPISDTLYTDAGMVRNFEFCQANTATLDAITCESYSVNGQTYLNSGTYSQTLINSGGCDSILTLNVTILPQSLSSLNITSCNSYTLNNQLYTSSGTYTQTLTNQLGCDSVITLNLTINSAVVATSQNQNSITSSATSALYQWINCSNNTPIAGATSQSFYPIQSGNYAVIVTQNGCTDTSNCVNFIFTGIEDEMQTNMGLTMYPNPASGTLNLHSIHPCILQIFSVDGKMQQRTPINSGENQLNINGLVPAVYVLEFNIDSKKHYRKLLVK